MFRWPISAVSFQLRESDCCTDGESVAVEIAAEIAFGTSWSEDEA
jgi:hypothetical protein